MYLCNTGDISKGMYLCNTGDTAKVSNSVILETLEKVWTSNTGDTSEGMYL